MQTRTQTKWISWSIAAATLTGIVASAPLPAARADEAVKAGSAHAAAKSRLAVLEFEYSTVQHWWGGDTWNIGRGISDLLVNELLKDGSFSLIERKKLDAILQEQQLGASGVTDPKTASQVGKVLGVNALVTGSITQFGFDDKSIGLGGIGAKVGGGLFGGLKKKESKATVVVTARLIDPTTGEILASAEGKGESKRGSWGGFGGGWNSRGAGGGGIDMTSSNFQDTILGEATRKCVAELAAKIEEQKSKIGTTTVSIAGKVADVDGDTVIVNVGKDAGINVGDKLVIEHVVRTVKDPDTGKVIKEVTDSVGTITITQADATSATGTFSGAKKPAPGDRVKGQ